MAPLSKSKLILHCKRKSRAFEVDGGETLVFEVKQCFAIPKAEEENPKDGENSNLVKSITQASFGCHLLDLPLEIRTLIYRFVLGYRTLHVTWTEGLQHTITTVPPAWTYSICECNVRKCPETTLGRIWAGEEAGLTGSAWKHAIPPAGNDCVDECGLFWFSSMITGRTSNSISFTMGNSMSFVMGNGSNSDSNGKARLDLSLLRVNKQINVETHEALYGSNVFVFTAAKSFRSFFHPAPQEPASLSTAQLNGIRNLSLCLKPTRTSVRSWNRRIQGIPTDTLALTRIRRLQIVLGPNPASLRMPPGPQGKKAVAEGTQDWAEPWLKYGFLAFAKLGAADVGVDVSQCYQYSETMRYKGYRHTETEKAQAAAFARTLEEKLLQPWEVVHKEMESLEEIYGDPW